MDGNKIGFEVAPWKSKPMDEYTNEELLEYWYKLRFSTLGKPGDSMAHWVTGDLQEEIIKRMEAK